MQNTPYQQMAKEFMDLWQKQISSVISDKQFIHAMLELFQNMQYPNASGNADGKRHSTSSSDPSHAPDADHGVLAELAFRLAMCEKRLAALEQQHKKPAAKRRVSGSHRRGSKKPRK